MGRRSAWTGVAAGIAAGVGLWFTRAVLDVVPGPLGAMRVAMFPSWPDLVGLVCLVLLVAFLARAATVRLGRTARHGIPRPGRVPPHVLLPFALVLLLGLPYLPWLPDLLPVLRVLAGPARFGVWAVALGLTAWLAWEFHLSALEETAPARPATARHAAAVFVASVLLYGGAAERLAGRGLYPGGDEPHYLVITQSLLGDHDLRIENNHARADYSAYFRGQLKPDFIARGKDGAIYSIHPIGLPVLLVPAFALAGYRGVVWCLVVFAATGATALWVVARRASGSGASATIAWLAAAGSAPFVLHSFAVYPEVTAAACALVALCWPGADEEATWTWVVRGLAVAALPWLGTKYAPMSVVIAGALSVRAAAGRRPLRLAAAMAPWTVSVALWLAFFAWIWGSPLPTAPYGSAHQTALANLVVGGPALFADQEYGVWPYAPALLMAIPGLWCLWRDGGAARRTAVEIALALGTLAATVGSYQMWWGGSAAPGRQVVAGLLLAGVPIARWDAHVARQPLRRALLRVLTLVGLVTSIAMVTVRGGLLAANGRDGTSQWLEWLAPGRELVRALPSAIARRDEPGSFFAAIAIWVVIALAVSWMARRWHSPSAGHGGVAAGLLAGAAIVVGAATVPALVGGQAAPAVPPEARTEAPLLKGFDARRRPVAVAYAPWRFVDAASVPALFRFDGTTDRRRPPQPLRVLFNMRLALPAGRYRATIAPAPGGALRGVVGLQVGRMGPAMIEWPVDQRAGAPWSASFVLGVDGAFVGLRASPEVEATASRLTVVPESVQNAFDRTSLPPVLSAARYGAVDVYFHGDAVYPERTGFWVRGRSTLLATFVQEPPADRDPAITLKVHSGAAATDVRFETTVWGTTVSLQPGKAREVRIPARPGTRLVSLRITPASGFIPAEQGGGTDRRLLGCWVEVID